MKNKRRRRERPKTNPATRCLTFKKQDLTMETKKTLWDTILKVIIAVASAILGAIGGNAMNA